MKITNDTCYGGAISGDQANKIGTSSFGADLMSIWLQTSISTVMVYTYADLRLIGVSLFTEFRNKWVFCFD